MVFVYLGSRGVDRCDTRCRDPVARQRKHLGRIEHCQCQRTPQQIRDQQRANALLDALAMRRCIVHRKQITGNDEQHRNAKPQNAVGEKILGNTGHGHRFVGRCPRLQVTNFQVIAVDKHQQHHRDK